MVSDPLSPALRRLLGVGALIGSRNTSKVIAIGAFRVLPLMGGLPVTWAGGAPVGMLLLDQLAHWGVFSLNATVSMSHS